MIEEIRDTEPFFDDQFLRKAAEASDRIFGFFVQSRADGGYTTLSGEWEHVTGGPIIECSKDCEGAIQWHDLMEKTHEGGGIDRLLTVKYYRPLF